MSEAAPSRRTVAAAVTRALLRGALAGVVLALVGLALACAGDSVHGVPGYLGIVFVWFFMGFTVTPVSLVELVAAARARSSGRDGLAALATFVVAWLSALAVIFELAYAKGVMSGGIAGGFAGVADFAHRLGHEGAAATWTYFAFPAAPFVPAVLGRIRGESLRRQILLGGAASGLLGLALLLPAFFVIPDFTAFVVIPVSLAITGAVLPLVYRVGDLLERPVVSRLLGDAARPAAQAEGERP